MTNTTLGTAPSSSPPPVNGKGRRGLAVVLALAGTTIAWIITRDWPVSLAAGSAILAGFSVPSE